MSRSTRRRREKGFALFLALLVLLVVTISGIALLFNTQIESSLSSTETKISRAFYAADSGIAWAGEQLRTNASFRGGAMPPMSANIPNQSPDIQVTVSQPILVGWAVHVGDPLPKPDGSGGIVENFFHMSSTSTSVSLQATKSITSDIGIYPSLMQIAR